MNSNTIQKAITSSNMEEVSTTFKTREVIYGDYDVGINLRTELLNSIKKSYYLNRGIEMPVEYQMLFVDVILKLNRLAVSPNHIDSWHDLEGYAKLAKQYIIHQEKQNENMFNT